MKSYVALFVFFFLVSCKQPTLDKSAPRDLSLDSLNLAQMIMDREEAMIQKNIEVAISQFSEDVTWINSQGYYFEGKEEVIKFHEMLVSRDSLDYYYKAGKPRIRIIDSSTALVYYSWKMFWFRKEIPTDTTKKEIGLMTLSAKIINDQWKWVAVTNQHTPWFYEDIDPVTID